MREYGTKHFNKTADLGVIICKCIIVGLLTKRDIQSNVPSRACGLHCFFGTGGLRYVPMYSILEPTRVLRYSSMSPESG